MESPGAAVCLSEWSSEDTCIGLMYSTSDSLSTCSSSWQYASHSVESDDNGTRGINGVTAKYRFSPPVKVEEQNQRVASAEPIDPPFEFQDCPPSIGSVYSAGEMTEGVTDRIVCDRVSRSEREPMSRSCCTPEPHSSRRPASRNSLNSRLSSSHNSLSVPTANKADDSSFITSAMSHDVLDLYNIPLDSDIYTLPVDSLRPPRQKRPQRHRKRRRNTVFVDGVKSKVTTGISPSSVATSEELEPTTDTVTQQNKLITDCSDDSPGYRSPVYSKRHSLPGPSLTGWVGHMHRNEPIHMTLHEVRQFLHNLYLSSPTDPTWHGAPQHDVDNSVTSDYRQTVRDSSVHVNCASNNNNNNNNNKINNNLANNRKVHSGNSKNGFAIKIKNRKSKSFNIEPDVKSFNNKNSKNGNYNKSESKTNDNCDSLVVASSGTNGNHVVGSNKPHGCGKNSFSYTLKQTLCNIFRFRRGDMAASSQCQHSVTDSVLVLGGDGCERTVDGPPPFAKRALPPLPPRNNNGETAADGVEASIEANIQTVDDSEQDEEVETMVDFASSIEKVKDYGWYWGPISGETAEKVLSNEPDGSFIVRDSSDDHYIFSLTFKLNGVIRHVRIEHDQGNFSFGSCAKFKSRTIVEFIENAVEHSRSGRYLFFLHRRPIHGPMRVQLLHPVSRFKQVQSLQHMCRFVILKVVRRDLIPSLPLPRRIIGYLNSPHYYSEHPSLPAVDEHYPSASPSLHLFSFAPPNS